MIQRHNFTLGQLLKHLREQNNLTQEFVAEQLNLTRSTYTYYENGKTEPNLKSLGILAKLYNVNLDIFLMDEKTFNFSDSNSIKKVFLPINSLNNLTKSERELVSLYRLSSPLYQRKALLLINKGIQAQREKDDSSKK